MSEFSSHPGHGSAGKTMAGEAAGTKKGTQVPNPAKAPPKAAKAVKGNFTGLV